MKILLTRESFKENPEPGFMTFDEILKEMDVPENQHKEIDVVKLYVNAWEFPL